MRLAYLWDADYPWDVRTEKVCRALTDAGHAVHIVARNRRWESAVERLPEGTVHRLPPWRALGQRLDGALSFPAFFSPRWIRHLARVVADERIDLIIARDLPLCPVAIRVGRAARRPVVFDMAEVYPALLQDVWDTGRRKPFDVLLRNPRAAQAVERYVLPRVDQVITVIEEARAWAIDHGAAAERTAIVSNTPALARVPPLTPPAIRPDGRLTVAYMGIMEVARGLGVLLQAAARLRETPNRVHLELIGGGRDLPLFRERAMQLGLTADDVTFHGYVPSHEDGLALVGRSAVGAVPHLANLWANTTIPNKLFDYMMLGRPVVSSDSLPCARIIRETGAGLLFPSGDADGLAERLRELADPARREALGRAGLRAVREHYHWERDAAALVGLVEAVGRRSAGR